MSPVSAYIHVPFCRHRCGYCNFALVADRDYLIDRFLNALEVELRSIGRKYRLQTLFLGGGTPTHLNARQLERLFEMLALQFDFSDAEVTTEANPNDLTSDKIRLLSQLGVNRFSLGVQSFCSDKLKLLERDHDASKVRAVVSELQKFTSNISLDMIFATMGETLDAWVEDLGQAVELGPKHLSTYELTIEKGTRFWKRENSGELVQTDEDLRAEMYQATIEMLSNVDLKQYEISSFAASGFQCRHNLVYWSGQPFLAFGAGAAGYLDGVRTTNHGSVSTYIKRLEAGESPVVFREELSPESRARELLVVGLRRMEGVNEAEYCELTGFKLDTILSSQKSQQLFELQLLVKNGPQLSMTKKGVLLYDSVAETILEPRN